MRRDLLRDFLLTCRRWQDLSKKKAKIQTIRGLIHSNRRIRPFHAFHAFHEISRISRISRMNARQQLCPFPVRRRHLGVRGRRGGHGRLPGRQRRTAHPRERQRPAAPAGRGHLLGGGLRQCRRLRGLRRGVGPGGVDRRDGGGERRGVDVLGGRRASRVIGRPPAYDLAQRAWLSISRVCAVQVQW